jgi:hypothetical protein
MVKPKGLTNVWKITLDAWCFNAQESAILNSQWLSGGITPHIIPH